MPETLLAAAMDAADEMATTRTAFEWERALRSELNAAHEGQFHNFGDAGARVLNGWAAQDPGDPTGAWVLSDKGKALTEAEFRAGVAAFFSLTFR